MSLEQEGNREIKWHNLNLGFNLRVRNHEVDAISCHGKLPRTGDSSYYNCAQSMVMFLSFVLCSFWFTICLICSSFEVHILCCVTSYSAIYYSSDHINISAKQISKKKNPPIIHSFIHCTTQCCAAKNQHSHFGVYGILICKIFV